MKTLTEEDLRSMEPLPPTEMLKWVQRRFAEEFKYKRETAPAYAYDRAIILDMLENPVWGKWGQIGSYNAARNILNRYLPGWSHIVERKNNNGIPVC